ncbi:hypothetical protein CXP35_17175 (plasmid) [Komagataeibacter xylinus]|nr:hypothetical protein CXP35_17175 [Komagataeibacter xylinus]
MTGQIAALTLPERTGCARNRIYVAGEVLTIPNHPFGEEPVRRSCQSRDRRKTSLQMSVLVTSLGPPDNPMERLKSLFHSDIPAKTAIQPLICHSFGLSDPSGRNGRSVIERQMEHCEAYEP